MNEGSAIAILFTRRYNSHPLKSRRVLYERYDKVTDRIMQDG